MLSVQLRFALTVKLGPASAILAPISTWSAVGEVRDVAAELIPSLTSAFTETEAVLVVLQLPALPLHCASAWLTLMAEPSTIAARIKRVAFIFFCSKVACGRQLAIELFRLSFSTDKTGLQRAAQRKNCRYK